MRIQNITLGTAGHIDHGKSALIYRLTGTHPDHLKEEQERGMTIDLGYADFEISNGLRVGIIDVPGHERFIKNMVAGATSMDLVLLVVAADDGVMPQTREHLTIMAHLGITKGVIALSKIDLVDQEMLELATEDVRDLVQGTFLEDAPVVSVSSLTGEGIDRLRFALESVITSTDPERNSGAFRMPIQRAFTMNGFGTVVTGVPVSGTAKVGDLVEVFPHDARGKIRTIQFCSRSCDEARAGNRTALNISDVDYRSLRRGDVVAAPGSFRSVRFFEAVFHLSRNAGLLLKNMADVRIHTGTAEVLARIVLLDKEVIEPGETALVQLRLRVPLVVVPGDRFIVRIHSPMITVGGGLIVGLTPRKLKRFKKNVVDRVSDRRESLGDLQAMILVEAEGRPDLFFSLKDIAWELNVSIDQVAAAVCALRETNGISEIQQNLFMHRKNFDRLSGKIVLYLEEQHRLAPLTPFLDMKSVQKLLGLAGRQLTGLLDAMKVRGLVETAKGGLVRRAGFIPDPTGHASLMDRIEDKVRESGAKPPMHRYFVEAMAGEENLTVKEAESVVRFMVESKRLVAVGAYLFHSSIYEAMREAVVEILRKYNEVNFTALRERFDTTRKWILPLLDHFDSIGLTCWIGNKRRLKENKKTRH